MGLSGVLLLLATSSVAATLKVADSDDELFLLGAADKRSVVKSITSYKGKEILKNAHTHGYENEEKHGGTSLIAVFGKMYK